MTTYCIDENKNLVNTLAITKREFTFNIQIASPVQEGNTWSFLLEYDINFISFLNLYKDNILSVNMSGTLFYDLGTSLFPAFIIYNPDAYAVNLVAYISLNGYLGTVTGILNSQLSPLILTLIDPTDTTTPTWVQGNTYTLVVTVYIAS